MIAPIIKAKEPARNEPCPCGSRKKYKKCCMKKQNKRLSQQGFQACFKKLVMDAGGKVDVSCLDMDLLPKDEGLAIRYDAEEDSFNFMIVKVKKSVIIQPDKKLRI